MTCAKPCVACVQPEVTHHFGGGVYAKQVFIPAGNVVAKHKHNFDHLSILARGVVQIEVDGEVKELTGPACITVSKDKYHLISALTDCVWFCIHATDCVDEAKIDEVLIAPQSSVSEILALAGA